MGGAKRQGPLLPSLGSGAIHWAATDCTPQGAIRAANPNPAAGDALRDSAVSFYAKAMVSSWRSGRWGLGPGLEALLASAAKRGADEMADRYLIENREAAVGVQVLHLRQRWGAAIWRAQTLLVG
jgi:hypothetical protein